MQTEAPVHDKMIINENRYHYKRIHASLQQLSPVDRLTSFRQVDVARKPKKMAPLGRHIR